MLSVATRLLAEGTKPAAPQGSAALWSFLVPAAAIFFIMYVLVLRPKRKEEQKWREMLESIRKGDHVVTAGGIHGEVVSVKEDVLIVQVDPERHVTLKVSKTKIARVLGAPDRRQNSEDDGSAKP